MDFGITLCEVPEEVNKSDIERLSELGINWVRFHFSWRHIEKEKGKFDFSFYDELCDKIREKGISILGCIGCGYSSMLPLWILNENKEELNLFTYIPQISRFVNETVEHFQGRIEVYQAENEINHTSFHVLNGWREKSWLLNPLGDISVLLAIISSIKANSPSSKVMINLECDNPNWESVLKFFIKKKLPFDIIGIDFYPCYPLTFSADDPIFNKPFPALKLKRIIDKAGRFKKPVIVAETGYPCNKGNFSYKKQEKYIRYICQSFLSSNASLLFMWEFADQYSKKPEFPEYYFGLLDNKRNPKPGWNAYLDQISQTHKTILVSVKGFLFKEPKPGIKVYINNELAGWTNVDGLFLSDDIFPSDYTIKIEGFFPWQVRRKKIKLKDSSLSIEFFV